MSEARFKNDKKVFSLSAIFCGITALSKPYTSFERTMASNTCSLNFAGGSAFFQKISISDTDFLSLPLMLQEKSVI